MHKLSLRQQRILEFIRHYRSDRGFAPSIRDIQRSCDISSTSVVDYNLHILQREGYVLRSPEVSRGLQLVNGDSHGAEMGETVPVLGYIAAGIPFPVPTDESWRHEPMETVTLPPELTNGHSEELYALRVHGLSMIDALIDDGDVVVLRRSNEVRDGDMVAAWLRLEQEATLKRIYREGDTFRLQPANSQMDPIMVPAGNVEVHGKVVAVIRRLD